MDIINQFCEKHELSPNAESDEALRLYVNEVVEIIKGNITGEEYSHPIMNKYCAFYYNFEANDNINAERYFLIGIKQNDASSMYNLAILYQRQKKYELAEKYYTLRVKHESEINKGGTINNLAFIQYVAHKDNIKALRYYKLALMQKCREKAPMESLQKTMNAIKFLSMDERDYQSHLIDVALETNFDLKEIVENTNIFNTVNVPEIGLR